MISTAALALLAPRAHRRGAIEFLMAWRVICSYVDELGEQPSLDPFANGLQLHRALIDAVSPTHPLLGDYYALHGDDCDGGYLAALVAVCRQRMTELPTAPDCERVARLGARRCAEAQSHMHTAAQTGSTKIMQRWAQTQLVGNNWQWWEIVAASIADLPIMAALAATGASAEETYAAHWPAALLASLLDSIADLDSDRMTGNYSLVVNYDSDEAIRDRLAVVAGRARDATRALPSAHIHTAIVAGVLAHYSLTPGGRTSRGAQLIARAQETLRPTITPILTTVRIYRFAARS